MVAGNDSDGEPDRLVRTTLRGAPGGVMWSNASDVSLGAGLFGLAEASTSIPTAMLSKTSCEAGLSGFLTMSAMTSFASAQMAASPPDIPGVSRRIDNTS